MPFVAQIEQNPSVRVEIVVSGPCLSEVSQVQVGVTVTVTVAGVTPWNLERNLDGLAFVTRKNYNQVPCTNAKSSFSRMPRLCSRHIKAANRAVNKSLKRALHSSKPC